MTDTTPMRDLMCFMAMERLYQHGLDPSPDAVEETVDAMLAALEAPSEAVAVLAVASLWQGFRNSEATEQACASRGWRYTEGRGMAACIDQSGIMREFPARRNGA